jgi:hypothetical protein
MTTGAGFGRLRAGRVVVVLCCRWARSSSRWWLILHVVRNDTFARLTASRRQRFFLPRSRLRLAVKRAIPCRERYSVAGRSAPNRGRGECSAAYFGVCRDMRYNPHKSNSKETSPAVDLADGPFIGKNMRNRCTIRTLSVNLTTAVQNRERRLGLRVVGVGSLQNAFRRHCPAGR